jgi:hypothetical protein
VTAFTITIALVRDKLLLASSALERGDIATAVDEFAAASAALSGAVQSLRKEAA